jgi:hypothetical protein
MKRFWTCYWQNCTWRPDVNAEYEPTRSSLSDTFRKHGVSVGDVAYIVSLIDGQLFLGGRITVSRIVSRARAVRILGHSNLWRAKECIIDDEGGSIFNLHRRLAPALTRQLHFLSPKHGPIGLRFVSNTNLDVQTARGVRELTPESAALLERIIAITDRLPRSEKVITVTEEMLRNGGVEARQPENGIPEETPTRSTHVEGNVQKALVNRYERAPLARQECAQHYGTTCTLCGFDFVAKYGKIMEGFIHVHHLMPLSDVGKDYKVDAIRDLRPVCPNCHAVLHHRDPPYSLDEVREFLHG